MGAGERGPLDPVGTQPCLRVAWRAPGVLLQGSRTTSPDTLIGWGACPTHGGEAGALQRGTRMVLIDVYPPRMTVKPARQSPVAARPTRRRNRYRDAALRGWR